MIQAVDRAAIGAQPELGLTSCEEHQWVQKIRLRVRARFFAAPELF